MNRALLLVALALPAAAQDPGLVQRFSATTAGDHVKLTFECNRPPVASLYAKRFPDRLVVELSDAQLGPSARSGGAPRGLSSLALKDLDLTHVQATLGLRYRLPASQVKATVTGTTLTVDLDMAYEFEETFALTPGIEWKRIESAGPASGYLLWNELRFNPADPHVRVDVGLAKDRLDSREKPTDMIARTNSIAAVNGGYFATAGGPLGVVVKDGKILSPHVGRRPPRTVWGVMKDKSVEFAQVIAKGQSLMSRGAPTWNQIQLALGGGPRLVARGQVALTTDEEELGPKGNDITRVTARTALATTRDGKMLICTATGYHDNHMEGVRLETLAVNLLKRGASEAMNLDGGASVTMAIGKDIVSNGPNAPATQEKAVATAVLVGDDRPSTQPARLQLGLATPNLPADGAATSEVYVQVTDPSGKPVADGTPVHFYGDHVAIVQDLVKTKGGKASTKVRSLRSPGPGKVKAECGGTEMEVALKLDAGPAAKMLARVTPGTLLYPSPPPSPVPSPTLPVPTGQQAAVTVQLNDSWGNAVSGAPVQIADDQGGEVFTGATGSNGQSSTLLQLPLQGAKLQVTSEGMPPPRVLTPPPPL